MSVTVLIDSNHNDRTIPAVGDQMRVKAREGVFVALRVDVEADRADLLRAELGPQPEHTGVPLSLISPADDYLPELFPLVCRRRPTS
jgi:hypothetical protein